MGFDDVFAVIAERTRRQILENLRHGDKAVGELVVALQVSQPTVSKHLKVLREAGLVSMRAQGQKRYYSLEREPLGRVGGWLTSLGAPDGELPALESSANTADAADAVATAVTAVPAAAERLSEGGERSRGTAAPAAPDLPVVDLQREQDLSTELDLQSAPETSMAPDIVRPQSGWTSSGVGRAAGRAADLLAQLRRRRGPST